MRIATCLVLVALCACCTRSPGQAPIASDSPPATEPAGEPVGEVPAALPPRADEEVRVMIVTNDKGRVQCSSGHKRQLANALSLRFSPIELPVACAVFAHQAKSLVAVPSPGKVSCARVDGEATCVFGGDWPAAEGGPYTLEPNLKAGSRMRCGDGPTVVVDGTPLTVGGDGRAVLCAVETLGRLALLHVDRSGKVQCKPEGSIAACRVEGSVDAAPSATAERRKVVVETEGEGVLSCGQQRQRFDKRTELDVIVAGDAAPVCVVRSVNRLGSFVVEGPMLARCGGGDGFHLTCNGGTVDAPPEWPVQTTSDTMPDFEPSSMGARQGVPEGE